MRVIYHEPFEQLTMIMMVEYKYDRSYKTRVLYSSHTHSPLAKHHPLVTRKDTKHQQQRTSKEKREKTIKTPLNNPPPFPLLMSMYCISYLILIQTITLQYKP